MREAEREKKKKKMNITIIKLLRSFGTGPKRLVKRSTKYNVYRKRLRASCLAWAPCASATFKHAISFCGVSQTAITFTCTTEDKKKKKNRFFFFFFHHLKAGG